MESVRAKKYLGQHFLTDLGAAQRIADSVADYLGTPILEVGPGMGVLTPRGRYFFFQMASGANIVSSSSSSE